MRMKEEQFRVYVNDLQSGYVAGGRRTRGNERLAFLIVLVAMTKRSISEVLKITPKQFKKRRDRCIFRGLSPKAQEPYYIEFPLAFYEYLQGYRERFHISDEEGLFQLEADYVERRFRELQKVRGYPFGIYDIRKIIPFSYRSKHYKDVVENYIDLLFQNNVSTEKEYLCRSGKEICSQILDFMRMDAD